MTVRTRIAPSPTGYLHIGTARTALFNYLFAKRHNGKFIVRIEDTDVERSTKEFENDILDGLSWLGLTWDEGPGADGPCGPYRQSERIDRYEQYLRELFDRGRLYPCFCTKEELEAEREIQVLSKQPPKYSGKCRNLSDDQRREREGEGKQSTLRFKIPQTKITVTDLVRGALMFDTSTLDDFIVAKDFRSPLYNFAVVVDDHLMNITHVIRGEEHISNIPKQVLMCEALGFFVPQFAHVSLILNADRSKLSKRQNKVSLLEYRTEGYLSEAIINFSALLGWNPGGDREIFSLSELSRIFDISQVNKAGAIFDLKKLDWFNNHYIRTRPLSDIVELSVSHLIQKGILQACPDSWYTTRSGERISRDTIKRIVELERERLKKISELPECASFFFEGKLSYDANLLAWKTQEHSDIRTALEMSHSILSAILESDFTPETIERELKEGILRAVRQTGSVLWPLRVALTGQKSSPPPFDVASILGKERALRRITDALSLYQ